MRKSAQILEDGSRLFGPYYRKDGRQHVILIYADGRRRTVSYPKFLMERKLGRELDPKMETVDHIDTDFTNNSYSNLRVIPLNEHAKDDAWCNLDVRVAYVWCNVPFHIKGNRLHDRGRKKAGPFCSKSCAGRYGNSLQHGGKRLENHHLPRIKSRRKWLHGDVSELA